jgi:hypothetical protein
MAGDMGEERLITHAMTRNQQASRAFAAELLAPIKYIQSQRTGHKLPYHRVQEIAHQLRIGSDVVTKQALNNGIQIGSI